MKDTKKSYRNEEWYRFANSVKKRDGYKCTKCGRKEPEVILQVHHTEYKKGLEPWEYPLSNCITVCKGCHAREHNLIEPSRGWTLISIEDLEGLYGVCERKGCGSEIRYEHIIYHPQWGYKSVGSTCVEYLTQEEQELSKDILKVFKKINDFVSSSYWENGITKKGNSFITTTHSHNIIRIYGKEKYYSFQIALKEKGKKWYDWEKPIKAYNKDLSTVKELSYIVLKGLTSYDNEEVEILRNIYKKMI